MEDQEEPNYADSDPEDALDVLSQHSGLDASFGDTDETDDESTHPELWTDLDVLLADNKGMDLFEEFLKGEGVDDYRMFYLSMVGWKQQPFDHPDHIRMPHCIYSLFVRLSPPARCQVALPTHITECLTSTFEPLLPTASVSETVFDAAYAEVRTKLQRVFLPKFLQESEQYLSYLNEWRSEQQLRDREEESDRQHRQQSFQNSLEALAPDTVHDYGLEQEREELSRSTWQTGQLSSSNSNHNNNHHHSSAIVRDDSGVFASTPHTPHHHHHPLGVAQQQPMATGYTAFLPSTHPANGLGTRHTSRTASTASTATVTDQGISGSGRSSARPNAFGLSLNSRPTIGRGPLAPLTSKNLATLEANSSKTRQSTGEPILTLAGKLYQPFLPPSVQASASEVGSYTAGANDRPFGQKKNPDVLSRTMATKLAARNMEDPQRMAPKTLLEMDKGNPQKHPVQDKEEFFNKICAKLNVLSPRAQPTAQRFEDDSDKILEDKADRIWANRTPDSPDSPGTGSPVPQPRQPGNMFLSVHRQSGLRNGGPSARSPFLTTQNGQSSRAPGLSPFLPGPFNSSGASAQAAPNSFAPSRPSGYGVTNGLTSAVRGLSIGQRPANGNAIHPYENLPGNGASAMHSAQRGAVQPQLQSARRPQNFTQPAVGQSRETTHHQTAPLRGSSRISAPLSRTVRRRAQGDAAADDASTTVLYRWGHASTEYFMSKLTGRPDLKNFKNTILSAKQRAESGFRFSFKIELKPHEVVFMDVSDDDEILPLYEHRITATIIEK